MLASMKDELKERVQLVRDLTPKWLQPFGALEVPDDLLIEQSGLEFAKDSSGQNKDEMDCIWHKLREREGGREFAGYRVIKLLQMTAIPLDVRSDSGLLQKMKTVLRAAYGSRVQLVYLAAGIYGEQPIGVIQCYGVAVWDKDLDKARQKADLDLMALRAALSGSYRQIRLSPLTVRIAQWLFLSMEEMPYAVVTVGQPDPREVARDSNSGMVHPLIKENSTAQQLSVQQNEILFRGMSDLQEEFLFLVLTSPVKFDDITEMLTGLAEHTSAHASWQQGARSVSFGVSLPAFLTGALAQNAGTGVGTNEGQAHANSQSQGTGIANSVQQAHGTSVTDTQGWSHEVGVAKTVGSSNTVTDGASHSDMVGGGSSHSSSDNQSDGFTPSAGIISATHNRTWGDTNGNSSSWSSTDTSSHSVASGTSESETQSESWGTSGAHAVGSSDSLAHGSTLSQSQQQGSSDSLMRGSAQNQALGFGAGQGLSVGVAPSLSMSQSFQFQYDPAIIVTQILRAQQKNLNTMSIEGGYQTDVYALARTPQGKKALMGLIPESFCGTEDVITGVQTRDLTEDENKYIVHHMRAFSPSTRIETVPEVLTGYMDSTMLTMLQLSAYTSPGMFEQGSALTVQEATPNFAFFPNMQGDAQLAHQFSSETGQMTNALLRLSREKHFHTAFCGDTGFGKSVAAERLAFETTVAWHFRTPIFDFGQGWRRALNWPGLEGRVDIRQLFPGARRPLRWNFLKVPTRLDPSRYRTKLAELFANAGRMGPRQLGFMKRAFTDVYLSHGVMTFDELPPQWSQIRDEKERDIVREVREKLRIPGKVVPGTRLADLQPPELQALAVHRSQLADVREWVGKLKSYFSLLPKGDQGSRTSLEGIILRVEQFSESQMARQYGSGPDTIAVEDLGLMGPEGDQWGITVIEGGAEMDEFAKAALFSVLASVLYDDAVVRRREVLSGTKFPPMQIFFEEANKVLSGVSGGAASDQPQGQGSKATASELWTSMWRDGRKYSIFLHVLAQNVSELPPGILSSCNNAFFSQSKDPNDQELMLSHIGRSPKGFVNTEYQRYLSRMPRELAICRLGYSLDVTDIEPILCHPMRVPGNEPSDEEIVRKLGLVA